METRPQVLFGLGVVVGPAGLLQLITEVVFLQLSGIADHELLGKVLQGKRTANTLSDGGTGHCLHERTDLFTVKMNIVICASGCVKFCKSESEYLHIA